VRMSAPRDGQPMAYILNRTSTLKNDIIFLSYERTRTGRLVIIPRKIDFSLFQGIEMHIGVIKITDWL
jgi:hypothetical protein